MNDDGEHVSALLDVGGVGLRAGVPVVRGWAQAEAAAELLRAELDACEVGERMCVRARVSAAGAGVVELGWVSPELARLLAGLLARARTGTSPHDSQHAAAA